VDLYGTRAAAVAAFCGGKDPALPGVRMTEGEVRWAIRHEQALHLADVLQRRSPLAIQGQLTPALVETVARVMAGELGWSPESTRTEITRFTHDLATWHGVRLAAPEGPAA
jgi:glycerol-3-phosphate dehydrogenase